MALTIRPRDQFGGEAYDVLSGDVSVGFIIRPASATDRPVYRWGLNLGLSGHRVSPSLARAKEGVFLAWREWLRAAALAETEVTASEPLPSDAIEADVDAALAEFGGDTRATIRALLHDIGVLASDAQAVISRGYVRGVAFTSARAMRRSD
jgi:hypothetical protein